MPETVIKPSTKLISAQYAAAAALAVAIAFFAASRNEQLIYALLLVPAFLALSAAKEHLRVAFTKITISEGRLRYQEGIFSRDTRTLDLAKLQDVRVTQTLLQRMTGIGDLIVENAAESGPLSMRSVDDPQAAADRILNFGQK